MFTSFAPVTLSKGVVGGSEFLDWMLSASADVHTGPTGANLRRAIDVITFNDRGRPGVSWPLQNAMPICPPGRQPQRGAHRESHLSIAGIKRTTQPGTE